MNLTRFEYNLIRLNWIAGKMSNIYLEFEKIKEKENEYGLKSTLREFAVIQLHTFIKIRKSLLTDFKEKQNGIILDQCLDRKSVV